MTILSLDEFKSWLGISNSAEDDVITAALKGAESFIEWHTGRSFNLQTAQTKLYYPDHDGVVRVHDLVSVDSIKIDTNGDRMFATTLTDDDYELLPNNELRYNRIKIWPRSSYAFTSGRLVQVIGDYGYVINGNAPDDIKLACRILANRFRSRKDSPFGILGATELGQYERISKEDPDVVNLLRPYVSKSGSAGSWILV